MDQCPLQLYGSAAVAISDSARGNDDVVSRKSGLGAQSERSVAVQGHDQRSRTFLVSQVVSE